MCAVKLLTNTYPIAAGKCHKDFPNPTISCHVYIMACIVVIFCLLNNMRSYCRLKWLSLVHHQSVTNSHARCNGGAAAAGLMAAAVAPMSCFQSKKRHIFLLICLVTFIQAKNCRCDRLASMLATSAGEGKPISEERLANNYMNV